MGLFKKETMKNYKNENVINESLNDVLINLRLLDEKINLCPKITLSQLECELVSILLNSKDTSSKVLWNIYLPITKGDVVTYTHIDCLLIRNDRIFVFCYENYKDCIGFKIVNDELWEFEYFTKLKLEKNLITKAKETTYFLSKFLNLDKKIELFTPVIILVGANSSKNIFELESSHIYLRDSHIRFLKEKILTLINLKNDDILSNKWVLKITTKLFPLMNPQKKLLRQIIKSQKV